MATDLHADPGLAPVTLVPAPPPGAADGAWTYDRSAIRADVLVTFHGQTVEEYWEHRPPRLFCEYIDGVIYMPNSPAPRHQDVALFLLDLLNGFRYERGGLGPLRYGPGSMELGPTRFPQPDVFVLPPEGGAEVPALFLIEILSPSTRAHDLGLKRAIYREAGIPEFWYVDLDARQVTVEQLGPDGYRTEAVADGRLAPAPLPGFWIEAEWLWADPLPNPRRLLEAILAGP